MRASCHERCRELLDASERAWRLKPRMVEALVRLGRGWAEDFKIEICGRFVTAMIRWLMCTFLNF